MIRIELSKEKKQEMEDTFWGWFSKYHMKNALEVFKKDKKFLDNYFEGNEKITEFDIRTFLLAPPEKLMEMKPDKKQEYLQETVAYLNDRYTNYRDSQAAKIIKIANIHACPYCNQNRISIINTEKNIIFDGEIDHYFNKAYYPEFSICLYNLIPVCRICNKIKGDAITNFVNPYSKNYNSRVVFRIDDLKDKGIIKYLLSYENDFEISMYEELLSEEDRNEVEILKIKERYKYLKADAQELIYKNLAYPEMYITDISEEFKFGKSFIERNIFGFSDDDNNRPMSKFNRDIWNQLRLLR